MSATYREIVDKIRQASAAGDFDEMFSHFTPDATFRVIGSHAYSRTRSGREEILSLFAEVLGMLDHDTIDRREGPWGVGEGVLYQEYSLKCKTTKGKDYINEYVMVYRFEGDKVSSMVEFMDTDHFVKAVLEG